MKKLLPILVLCISQLVSAQEKDQSIGFFYSSFGANGYFDWDSLKFLFDKDLLTDINSVEFPPSGEAFYDIGLSYTQYWSKNVEFQSGITYSRHRFEKEATLIQENLLEIPVGLKINLVKYLFIKGDILLDFNLGSKTTSNTRSGIGFQASAGLQFPFQSGLNVYLSPFYNGRSILPFSDPTNNDPIISAGLRIGMSYRI